MSFIYVVCVQIKDISRRANKNRAVELTYFHPPWCPPSPDDRIPRTGSCWWSSSSLSAVRPWDMFSNPAQEDCDSLLAAGSAPTFSFRFLYVLRLLRCSQTSPSGRRFGFPLEGWPTSHFPLGDNSKHEVDRARTLRLPLVDSQELVSASKPVRSGGPASPSTWSLNTLVGSKRGMKDESQQAHVKQKLTCWKNPTRTRLFIYKTKRTHITIMAFHSKRYETTRSNTHFCCHTLSHNILVEEAIDQSPTNTLSL